MKTMIVAIGNSKGVRIPKAFLSECHMSAHVDMRVKAGTLVIKPVHTTARHGWAEAFQKTAALKPEPLLIPDGMDVSTKEWEW